MLAAPVAAQVPADRPTGTGDKRAPTGLAPDASVASLAPFAGRRVAAIDLTGHNVTKDWVITREIRTKVGEPLDLDGGGARRRTPRQPVDLRGGPGGRRARGRRRGAPRLQLQGDAVLVPDPLVRLHGGERLLAGAWASRPATSPGGTSRCRPASTSATSSSSGPGSPGPGSAATTGPSTSTARATRGRTSCAASRRRATSSRPRWARGSATTAGPAPSSRTSGWRATRPASR